MVLVVVVVQVVVVVVMEFMVVTVGLVFEVVVPSGRGGREGGSLGRGRDSGL